MKKTTFLLIAILILVTTAGAQEIEGTWLFTKVMVKNKVHEPLTVIEFNADGFIMTQGINVGSWSHNRKEGKLIMKTNHDKDFDGDCNIISLDQKELNFEKNGEKWFLSKLNMDKIAKNNSESGLIGSWEFTNDTNDDITRVLNFEAPDSFTLIEKQPGMESRNGGMWIFNSHEKSLLILARGTKINGKNRILKITDKELLLENSGEEITIHKLDNQKNKIERLSFTQDMFIDENDNYLYEADEEKLPWNDPYQMIISLKNTDQLIYKYANLIEDTEIFENKTLKADVETNEDEKMLIIDFIFYGYDRYNLPDDTQLPSKQLNFSFDYKTYPLRDFLFRISGEETITTKAGTFNCTLLEAYDSMNEESLKLWMVNDKPGVYAKIIADKAGMFGHYHIYELIEIIKK